MAWGWTNKISSSYYRERMKDVKKVLEEIEKNSYKMEIVCYLINCSNDQPRHPRRWDKLREEKEFVPFPLF